MPERYAEGACAIAVTVVHSTDLGFRGSTHSAQHLRRALSRLGCNLRSVGYRGDLVALLHGDRLSDRRDEHSAALEHQKWIYHEHLDNFSGWLAPERVQQAPSRLPLGARPDKVQRRRDGWATLYKLFAWRLRYRLVLHSDLDIVYHESPDRILVATLRSSLMFRAPPQRARRGYAGLSTHLMLLRPSASIASVLINSARTSHFLAYTHTEQDVLETVFTDAVYSAEATEAERASPLPPLPRHWHVGSWRAMPPYAYNASHGCHSPQLLAADHNVRTNVE